MNKMFERYILCFVVIILTIKINGIPAFKETDLIRPANPLNFGNRIHDANSNNGVDKTNMMKLMKAYKLTNDMIDKLIALEILKDDISKINIDESAQPASTVIQLKQNIDNKIESTRPKSISVVPIPTAYNPNLYNTFLKPLSRQNEDIPQVKISTLYKFPNERKEFLNQTSKFGPRTAIQPKQLMTKPLTTQDTYQRAYSENYTKPKYEPIQLLARNTRNFDSYAKIPKGFTDTRQTAFAQRIEHNQFEDKINKNLESVNRRSATDLFSKKYLEPISNPLPLMKQKPVRTHNQQFVNQKTVAEKYNPNFRTERILPDIYKNPTNTKQNYRSNVGHMTDEGMNNINMKYAPQKIQEPNTFRQHKPSEHSETTSKYCKYCGHNIDSNEECFNISKSGLEKNSKYGNLVDDKTGKTAINKYLHKRQNRKLNIIEDYMEEAENINIKKDNDHVDVESEILHLSHFGPSNNTVSLKSNTHNKRENPNHSNMIKDKLNISMNVQSLNDNNDELLKLKNKTATEPRRIYKINPAYLL